MVFERRYAKVQRTVIYVVQRHKKYSLAPEERHIRAKSIRAEYLQLLDKFGVEYDRRYLFKFVGD